MERIRAGQNVRRQHEWRVQQDQLEALQLQIQVVYDGVELSRARRFASAQQGAGAGGGEDSLVQSRTQKKRERFARAEQRARQ